MDTNKQKVDQAKGSREKSHGSAAVERGRLIRNMEQAWVEKEAEATSANARTAKPHGLLGKIGLNTATG